MMFLKMKDTLLRDVRGFFGIVLFFSFFLFLHKLLRAEWGQGRGKEMKIQ